MKKALNFALEFTIILGIGFFFVLLITAIANSNKNLAVLAIVSAVVSIVCQIVREKLSLYSQIRREQMHIHRDKLR